MGKSSRAAIGGRWALEFLRLVAAGTIAAGMLAGCREDSGPAFVVEGGGFIFNYRIAEVTYGVSVRPQRRLERGSRFVAEFENPAGGPPLAVEVPVDGAKLAYALASPPVEGVVADRPYRLVIRLLAPDGREIARDERSLRSDLDQSVNPTAPLTTGPGDAPAARN